MRVELPSHLETLPAVARLSAKWVFVIGALSALAPLSIDTYLPALPALSDDLSASPGQVQLTIAGCLVGLALGQLAAGPISDSVGRRAPLLVGLGLYTLASLLCAFAPTVWLLTAFRIVQGASGAAGVVIGRAIARDLYEGAAVVRLFGLTMLVGGLAPVLAPVAGAQLLRVASWRGTFVALALIGLVLLVAIAATVRETLAPERRVSRGFAGIRTSFAIVSRDGDFVGYVCANALPFAAMFVYIAGSPYVLQDVYGLSPQAFSAAFALNAIGIVTAAQIGGRLAGRVHPRRLLACGLGISATGAAGLLATALVDGPLVAILVSLFLVVGAIGLVLPNATALALRHHRDRAGSASAVLGATQFTIGGLAAPVVGLVGTGSAVPMAALIAGLSFAALVPFAVLTGAD
jgi:DHA1 family bicyclomycin/chloramphenicol resistance-like MFS transporter